MTEQLLFIDNKAMDINESTNITLNFRSNIFSDVSKITSNNTYSIKLPLTVNNCHVINYAHLPSHSAQYARINHKGRYLRNGIEIIPDASVILIEISETIDIAMTWGNVSKFAEIVNDNKTLQDLSYGRTENEDYIIWKKGDNSPRIPKIDYGFKNDEPAAMSCRLKTLFPSNLFYMSIHGFLSSTEYNNWEPDESFGISYLQFSLL